MVHYIIQHPLSVYFFPINSCYCCIILGIIHSHNQLFMMCTADGHNQASVIRSITAAGGDLPPPPCCWAPDIFPGLTGMPVTFEATSMNRPLIINVEGGGLAFDLARHRSDLYLAWRRKVLLIYETCCLSGLLLLWAYLVLPVALLNNRHVKVSGAVVSGTHFSGI